MQEGLYSLHEFEGVDGLGNIIVHPCDKAMFSTSSIAGLATTPGLNWPSPAAISIPYPSIGTAELFSALLDVKHLAGKSADPKADAERLMQK